MIVFLESDKNDFTTYLNPPIKASKVRLVSCSLYNSWYNLIGGKVIILSPTAGGGNQKVPQVIPDSHYTPITLAKVLAKHGYTLASGLPHEMKIKHDQANQTYNVSSYSQLKPLYDLLGVSGISNTAIPVKWKVPSSYEVYCNLVQSYHHNEKSHLMLKFPPKGNPFDLVEYTPRSLNHDLSCDLVSEINIVIKVDGETINFNGRKINIVLEFI